MTDRQVEGIDLDQLEETYVAFELAVIAALNSTMRRAVKDDAVAGTLARLSLDDLNVIPPVWAEQVPGLAEQVVEAYVNAANMQMLAYEGATGDIADMWTSEHAAAVDYLSQASNRLAGIGDELWADAREELLTGLTLGEDVGTISARVRKVTDVTQPRAVAIARTEIVSSSAAGSIAFMRSTGQVATKAWLTRMDGRERPQHAAANGQEVDLDAKFVVGGAFMDHPGDPSGPASEVVNCFPGDTLVSFPSIRSVTRRWYDGDLIRVRFASGNELSGTPNHPVLGAFGWVPLGEIKEGDDLVHASLVGGDATAPDVDRPPVQIGEVYRAAQLVTDAERVATSPPDFHGDGGNGEVEVVPVDGELRFDGEPASDEQILQFGLAVSDMARSRFSGCEDASSELFISSVVGRGASSAVFVGGSRTGASLGRGHLPHAHDVGFGLASNMHAIRDQSGAHVSTTSSDAVGNLQLAETRQVEGDDFLVGGFDAEPAAYSAHRCSGSRQPLVDVGRTPSGSRRDVGGGFPGEVALDCVVDVERVLFAGHVYNLDTGVGWYVANNTPARNCRCTMKFGLTVDSDDLAQDGGTLAASAQEDAVTVVELPTIYVSDLPDEDAALVAAMDPANTTAWAGVLCVDGARTGDHREFVDLSWGNLPMPLQWQKVSSHGGVPTDETVLVGRIDTIVKNGNEIYATGLIDLGSVDGREAARLMGTRTDPAFLSGVSIVGDDPNNGLVEVVFPAGCDSGELTPADMMRCSEPEVVIYHDTRIRAATLCDVPAIMTGQLYLTNTMEVDVPTEQPTSLVLASDAPTQLESVADIVEALTAAAHQVTIEDVPPRWFFDEPTDMPEIGGISVTDDGRFYGYVAPVNVAHRGIQKRTTVPLRDVDYSRWASRARAVTNEDGTVEHIATGPITMGCNHADTRTNSGAVAREHYENSCSIVATACIGENRNGVWIAGALMPDITAAQVARILACQLSGDWRAHKERPGQREFAGALLVSVPGFPVANRGARVTMQGEALVASAVPIRFTGDIAGDCDCGSEDAPDTANAARAIALSVGWDRAARAREIYLSTKV